MQILTSMTTIVLNIAFEVDQLVEIAEINKAGFRDLNQPIAIGEINTLLNKVSFTELGAGLV